MVFGHLEQLDVFWAIYCRTVYVRDAKSEWYLEEVREFHCGTVYSVVWELTRCFYKLVGNHDGIYYIIIYG